MNNLSIKPTDRTPGIEFDKTGILRVYGVSMSESYESVHYDSKDWLKTFVLSNNSILHITFEFDYYNTLNQRFVYEMLEIASKFDGAKEVYWYYDPIDEDMYESGETYKEMFPELNIKLLKK